MDKKINPINEFVIWNNCNNKCLFCQQVTKNKLSNLEKYQALQFLYKKINQFIDLTNVLIVGGEIFDQTDNNIINLLYQIYTCISMKIKKNDIQYLYINTNLLYSDLTLLFRILKIFNDNNQLDNIKFTTSYDIYGRFKNNLLQKKFKNNLMKIKKEFSNLNVVINVILTKQACHSIINDNKFLTDIRKYGYINFIPYLHTKNDIMTATRNEIYTALAIIETYQAGYIEQNIRNLDLPQKKNVFYYQNGLFNNVTANYNSCGHCINFNMYSSNDSCYICDIKHLFNIN